MMKPFQTLCTTILLSFFTLSGFAQIQLESTYNEAPISAIQIATNEFVYSHTPDSTTLVIYDLNHSEIKRFTNLPTKTSVLAYGISRTLFDTDNGIEFVLALAGANRDSFFVIDDDGTAMLSGLGRNAYPVQTNDGAKLLVYDNTSTPTVASVYSLPGTYDAIYDPLAVSPTDPTLPTPYPNPTAQLITLPVPVGSPQTVNILNQSGQVVEQVTSNGHKDHLIYNAGQLPPGWYTYQVEGLSGKPFIVR